MKRKNEKQGELSNSNPCESHMTLLSAHFHPVRSAETQNNSYHEHYQTLKGTPPNRAAQGIGGDETTT